MLSDLQQILSCRLEREDRAARAWRQARRGLAQARADAEAARERCDAHRRACKERRDRLYRQALDRSLPAHRIDDLNIELDLMDERTDMLAKHARDAEAAVAEAAAKVEEADQHYRRHRRAGERWRHLVDDIADAERRHRQRREELAIEDDLDDRRIVGADVLPW